MWLLPILALPPLMYLLSYAVMRLAGLPLSDPRVPLLLVPAYLVGYLIGDTGEEVGWSGYAIDPMQRRWGALRASLILGLLWAAYHSITFFQTGNTPRWIVWQSLKTVAMRVILVWLYNHTGKSVLATTLFHAADNTSWSLFPNNGSHYDPLVTGLINCLVALIITWGWPVARRVRGAGS